MKKKILFALLSTTILSHNLLSLDCTCTTTTEERAALERNASIVTVEQQRFSQPNLFSFPFFEPLTDHSVTAFKQWINKFNQMQETFKTTLTSGLGKKIAWARCDDKKSDEAKGLIEAAKAHFLSAAEGGSSKAMSLLSDIYKDEGNFIESFYWCFLGIEVNWIVNGTISETNYQSFKQLCQIDEIQQNIEASAIAPVIHELKTEDTAQNILHRIFPSFIKISKYYETNSFIASQQITGLARVANHPKLWIRYAAYLDLQFPFIRPDLATDSIEREREKYKAYVHSNEYARMVQSLKKFPLLLEEFHKNRKGKSIDTLIGDLYWKEIHKNKDFEKINNLRCYTLKDIKIINAICYYNLSGLIFNNKYHLDNKGKKIRAAHREEFSIGLLEKSLELNPYDKDALSSIQFLAMSKKIPPEKAIFHLNKAFHNKKNKSQEVIDFLATLILEHEFGRNERGEKIFSTAQRYEAIGRIYYQAIAKGFPFYASFLGNIILDRRLKYDQNNQLIQEEQRINIATQLYYDTLKYTSQLDATEKEKYRNFISIALMKIGKCLADKEINTDENNQPVSDENRSETCARIFNQAITLGDHKAKYEFSRLIYKKKIHHRQDGSLITSQEQGYEYAAALLRENIQQNPQDLETCLCSLAQMIFSNETDRDENNNIILPENKLDWIIAILSTDKMKKLIQSRVLLSYVLLNKNTDLDTVKKSYTLIKEAVMAGETEHFEQMENLKFLIEEEEEKELALVAKTEMASAGCNTPIAETQDTHLKNDEESAVDLPTTVHNNDSSSDSDTEIDHDEEMTQTSTSHVETVVETQEERALRKAKAKADRLLRVERREAFKKQLHQQDFSAFKKVQKLSAHEKHQKYELLWTDKARVDFERLLEAHRKKLTLIIDRIKNSENPYNGAEKLKGNLDGWFSHRINKEHRFVFKLSEDQTQIIIQSCYGHYE